MPRLVKDQLHWGTPQQYVLDGARGGGEKDEGHQG